MDSPGIHIIMDSRVTHEITVFTCIYISFIINRVEPKRLQHVTTYSNLWPKPIILKSIVEPEDAHVEFVHVAPADLSEWPKWRSSRLWTLWLWESSSTGADSDPRVSPNKTEKWWNCEDPCSNEVHVQIEDIKYLQLAKKRICESGTFGYFFRLWAQPLCSPRLSKRPIHHWQLLQMKASATLQTIGAFCWTLSCVSARTCWYTDTDTLKQLSAAK